MPNYKIIKMLTMIPTMRDPPPSYHLPQYSLPSHDTSHMFDKPTTSFFKLLQAIYRQTSHSPQKDKDANDFDDEGNSSNGTWSNTGAGPSANSIEPHQPTWNGCGEHPRMAWSLNNILSLDHYQIIIPDPTITNCHLIIAPYVTYSLQPNKAEVSATYGKGYPIHTCTLTPMPVSYPCPSASPLQLSLLTESPFANAITKIVEQHFPTAHVATLKWYQYFQQKKYQAQGRTQQLKKCLT